MQASSNRTSRNIILKTLHLLRVDNYERWMTATLTIAGFCGLKTLHPSFYSENRANCWVPVCHEMSHSNTLQDRHCDSVKRYWEILRLAISWTWKSILIGVYTRCTVVSQIRCLHTTVPSATSTGVSCLLIKLLFSISLQSSSLASK